MRDSITDPFSGSPWKRGAALSLRAVLLGGALASLPSCLADTDDTEDLDSREAAAAVVGSVWIRNELSGKCIDVKGAPGVDDRDVLQLWHCEYDGLGPNSTPTDQKWEWTEEGFIRNRLSGKCIDVKGAPGVDDGDALQLWDCEYNGLGPNSTPTDQKWEWTEEGFIRNRLSGKCIDVKGAPGLDNRDVLQLWDCEYSGLGPNSTITDQQWTYVR